MNTGTMGVNSLPKTVARQRRDCELNPGPSAPESSTLTTRLPSCAVSVIKRLSVRLAVCPVRRFVRLSHRSTAARADGGFAAEVGRGSKCRPIAAAAARHAGRVNFGPTVKEVRQNCHYCSCKKADNRCTVPLRTKG